MTKRAAKKYPPDPHQWYREPRSTAEQIFGSFDFGGGLIWDASCGVGNILDVALERGYAPLGTDIVDRPGRSHRYPFRKLDFLRLRSLPFRNFGSRASLVCNPPYGRVGNVSNMGERFVKHALDTFADELEHMAFLVPVEFKCGATRYWSLYRDRPPAYELVCCQRPSMPPGAAVEELGDAAFENGMADYSVLIWSRDRPSARCQTIFMEPDDSKRPPDLGRRIR